MDKVAAVEGDTVTITPLDTLATLTVTDEDSEEVVVTQDSSVYTFEMPASDVVIAATAPEEPTEKIDPELDWGDSVCTVNIDDADPQFLTLTNEHNVSPIVYSSSDSQVATIDAETGVITLVAEGTTNITAEFAGDDEYEADSVTYELTVEATQETIVNYTFWEDVTVGDTPFKRYLNEDTIHQEHIYTEQEFEDSAASLYVVHVDETDYTFEDKNFDANGYCWDDGWDGTTGAVAIKYNQDTVHPDIYVKTSEIGQGAVSATYNG